MSHHDIFLTAASDLIGLLGWLLIGYVAVFIIYHIWLVRNHHVLTRHQKRERRPDYYNNPTRKEK